MTLTQGAFVSSTYLKKSIATLISFAALGLSMEAGAIGSNNSSTGLPDDLDTIHVRYEAPYDYGNPFDDPAFSDPYNYEGDHAGGNDEGCGGGCGGGAEENASCPNLRMQKPDSCDGYQHLFGAAWGRGLYPANSGLSELLSLLNPGQPALFSSVPYQLQTKPWNMIYDALERHTDQLSVLTNSHEAAHEELLAAVVTACALEQRLTGVSLVNNGCYAPLRRLIAEQNGAADTDRNFWEDTALPYFVIDFFAPDNSLRIKYETMTAQNICNIWHQEMINNAC